MAKPFLSWVDFVLLDCLRAAFRLFYSGVSAAIAIAAILFYLGLLMVLAAIL